VNEFENSDAWIFLSVAYSAKKKPATLDLFFSAADHINCAIPTNEEIQGGINRLASVGLIHIENDTFTLSESGQQLFQQVCKQTAYPRMQPKLVKQYFNDVELPKIIHSVWHLSVAESSKALRIYKKRMSEALKEIRKSGKTKL
jgi:hypothetical protein